MVESGRSDLQPNGRSSLPEVGPRRGIPGRRRELGRDRLKPAEDIVNIPNLLSAFRLLAAPAAAASALAAAEGWFTVLIVACLISDILDGLIARAFGLETKFGALLDAIADDVMLCAALVGILVFKQAEIGQHIYALYFFVFMCVLVDLISVIKFGRFSSLHLYSFKITGYLQGFTLFMLFVFGFQVVLWYFSLLFGILACLEVIAATILLPRYRPNARGLYWLLQERKDRTGAWA